jgi:FSR family fosmidomycin resistance protein-like MFS transporter
MFGLQKTFTAIRGIGKERLHLLGVITGGHSVIHWYMEIFSVILPSMKAGVGLSDVQVGTLMSARQLTHSVLNLPSGMLADSLMNYRPILLAVAPAVMGVAYTLFGISPGFAWMLLASGLVGLGTAVWHPAAVASLSSRFPELRATAIAIHGMGANLSNTLTPLLVGALLVIFNWRVVLEFQFVPALLVAFLVWRSLSGIIFESAASRPSGSTQVREIGELAMSRVFIVIALIRGLMRTARLVILTFLPIYLQEHLGYSPVWVGFYLSLLYGIGIVSQPIMAILSDRFGRKTVLFPSMIMLGLLYLLLWFAAPGLQLGLIVATIGAFFFTLGTITTAVVMDIAGSKIQASSFALASSLTQVLALPAPILAGFLIGSYGIGSVFLMSAASQLLAALLLVPLTLRPGTKIRGQSQP